MFCPVCGTEISDEANFCEKCGAKLKKDEMMPEENKEDIQTLQEDITVELVEKEGAKKPCEICKNADMELVSEGGKEPLYRCPACGNYFGNFMRKGNVIYYDTTHLRIGQYVASQLIHGKFRVSVHKDAREKGIDELADRIRQDIKNFELKKIADAISYLINQNVFYTYYEPTPDGDFDWLGLAFSGTQPEDTQITK